jgi:hypothetical protein
VNILVDNNYELLYYKITGKICKNDNLMNGGVNNEKKNRGIGLLTEYWIKVLTIVLVFINI